MITQQWDIHLTGVIVVTASHREMRDFGINVAPAPAYIPSLPMRTNPSAQVHSIIPATICASRPR